MKRFLAATTFVVFGFALSGAAPLAAGADTHVQLGSGAAGYHWPVKPFNRAHPVRGGFGDPRTVFHAPPTPGGVMTGQGSFSFHQGADISAADGTSVYPTASGTVTRARGNRVTVNCGDGREFQYWHITPAVVVGEHVTVSKTVLGTILRGSGHVHLTELQDGRAVNPLARGHLAPYADTTTPSVDSISLAGADRTRELFANFVRGPLDIIVVAHDTPALRVPGIWGGMPVSPALLTWRIQDLGGAVIVPGTIAVDFRSTVPRNRAFWGTYARGTYQNMSIFGNHYSWRQPGRFLFKLTSAPLDTRAIEDGVYDLVVTATDVRGNSSSASLRLTVHNRSGWSGS